MALFARSLTFLILINFSALAYSEGPAVLVKTLSSQKLAGNYETVGRVDAVEAVDIIARAGGVLEQKLFVEGSNVEQGQTLFQIEQAPYKLKLQQQAGNLASAKASLKQAEAELQRSRRLLKSKALSRSEFDIAEAKRDQLKAQTLQAQAAFEQAELELSYTTIKSPIGGFIGKASTTAGNLISANSSSLATITRTDPVYVDIAVSDSLLLQFRQQGSIHDEPDAIPFLYLADGSRYDQAGSFNFIGHQVSRDTDTINIRLSFANPKGILLPGQFVKVHIEPKDIPEVIAVPQAAVQRDRQGTFVMLVDESNKVVQQRVKLGEQVKGLWIIESGLAAGQRVVVEGLQKIHSGLVVSPSEQ